MRAPAGCTFAMSLIVMVLSVPVLAKDPTYVSTDRVDDSWAQAALDDPEKDRGWCQSCDPNWNDGRVSQCEVRSFAFPGGKRPVAIRGGLNGGMTVMGWDRDSVRILYRVTARAKTEERARELAASIQLALASGWIEPQGPAESRSEWWSVEVKAWVPRTSNIALETVNGPLGVRGVKGTMELNSQNGPMSLVDLAGAVEARAQNGPLHVQLTGSKWDGTGLDAEAQNGPLNLTLPANYSAELVTGTISGPRAFEYAIEHGPRMGWINTTLGKGGKRIRVVTHNGPFHIEEGSPPGDSPANTLYR